MCANTAQCGAERIIEAKSSALPREQVKEEATVGVKR